MLSIVNFVGRRSTQAITPTLTCRKVRILASNSSSGVLLLPRLYSESQWKERRSSALTEAKEGSEVSTQVFESVKENTKTAGNLGVILLGFGIAGSILYAVFRELLSSNSPNNIYSSAFDACSKDERIQDQLGQPIKAYGEENSRGRRRHVSHSVYMVGGRKHMLVQFYIKGTRKRGTVFVELREDDSGNFKRQLLVVEVDGFSKSTIILEDNRVGSVNQSEPLPTLF